jgi:hypothetical protein
MFSIKTKSAGILVSCLVIAAVFVCFLLVLHLHPSEIPSNNFQTYSNQQFSFTLKYPTDWTIVNDSSDQVAFMPKSEYDQYWHLHPEAASQAGDIFLFFDPNPSHLSLEDYVHFEGLLPKSIQQTTIAGIPALLLDGGDAGDEFSAQIVLFQNKGVIIEVSLRDPRYVMIFQKLVQSIEFVS